MIQEIALLTIGYLTAYFIKQRKIVFITKQKSKDLNVAIIEAQKMQKRFKEEGGSEELCNLQTKNLCRLERHIAYKEILKEFNYLI